MQSVFDKLLDNLVVAALVPSLVFFTVSLILFRHIVPIGMVAQISAVFGTPAILILSCATCMSFVLAYLVESIYWFYRGSWMPKFLPLERHAFEKLNKEIKDIDDKIKSLGTQIDENNADLMLLDIERAKRVEKKLKTFPSIRGLLQTRFGNILAAAEDYPALRYNINANEMWMRLKQVIPADNMTKIDQVNHEMAFLINSSLLSLVLSAISCLAVFYQTLLLVVTIIKLLFSGWNSQHLSILSLFSNIGLYAICIVVFLFSSWIFYRLSIPIAQQYAEMYRCAFDLFRFQLSEKLRFGCPQNTLSERDHWAVIYATLNSEPGSEPVNFTYIQQPHPDGKSE